ncbi:glycosyltransferase family 4 protein [Kocuria coralli]|uniref:Glycosyltransferase family 4 protein n=1 Tax=Kocuria coralli TaxID=1461025 RepID=A0A5J5KW57_9MICC|nr:glycosyltransferase family 4 protein [Kocuria coralli]KAA9393879.1 glycosyltransferase family 4 protein [Kocuria coralli]
MVAPAVPPGARPGQWFPHPLLDPAALSDHARSIDAVHLHFGFEHRTPAQVRTFVTSCRELGIELILTVHDLDNPHLVDQTSHYARLSELVPAARHVVTLTDSAAFEVEALYGSRPAVIPHPFVVAPPLAFQIASRHMPHRTGRKVCIFLKDVRANTVTDPAFFLDLAHGAPETEVHVFAHRSSAEHPLLHAMDRWTHPRVHLHERMPDRLLHETLAAFDVAVLPYLRGSHSGWLEMCRDLSVTVVAPDCGHYGGQADRHGAIQLYSTGDGSSAASAVSRAIALGPLSFGGDRLAQHQQILGAHRLIYSDARRHGPRRLQNTPLGGDQ